jgi:signal transduction histidine kinase
MPEDDVRKVTAPFFTTREEVGGTGLGMSISDTIIRRHKGSMSIASELGMGTEVIVKLPVTHAMGDGV